MTDDGESFISELDYFKVPESRDGNSSRELSLAYLKIPSTSQNPGHPIIYLSGGPGNSAIRSAKTNLITAILELRRHSDVILLEQRGAGLSTMEMNSDRVFTLPLDQPITSDATRRIFTEAIRSIRDEMSSNAIRLDSYNTLENAHDIEALRKALNLDSVIIWGQSYGTHLALAYARAYPSHISKMILGGINGLDQRLRTPEDGQIWLRTINNLVHENTKLSKKVPDFIGLVDSVFDSLQAYPKTVEIPLKRALRYDQQPWYNKIAITVRSWFNGTISVTVYKEDVQMLIGLQAGNLEFIRSLPFLFYSMKRGDYSTIALQIFNMKNTPVGSVMRYPASIASGCSAERLALIASQKDTCLLSDMINFPFNRSWFTEEWKVTDLGHSFRAPFTCTIPTLFVSGTLDGRTSMTDADAVRKNFTHASNIIIEGASHEVFTSDMRVLALVDSFIIGQTLDRRIAVPTEFWGIDELYQSDIIYNLAAQQGIEIALKRVAKITSDTAKVHITGFTLYQSAQRLYERDQKAEEALVLLEMNTRLFPNFIHSYELAGDIEARRKNTNKANEWYAIAFEKNPFFRRTLLKKSKTKPQ